MKVQIRYYAKLRDEAGVAVEVRQTDATTVADLWAEVAASRGLTLDPRLVKAAQNDEFCPWEAPLVPGATVVFMPPVAGG